MCSRGFTGTRSICGLFLNARAKIKIKKDNQGKLHYVDGIFSLATTGCDIKLLSVYSNKAVHQDPALILVLPRLILSLI